MGYSESRLYIYICPRHYWAHSLPLEAHLGLHSVPGQCCSVFLCLTCRCWRVLRLWITVCCWGCITWTRLRGSRTLRALRAAVMGRDHQPRKPCTPLPWSPSKEPQRAERTSTQRTREHLHLLGHQTPDIPTFMHFVWECVILIWECAAISNYSKNTWK